MLNVGEIWENALNSQKAVTLVVNLDKVFADIKPDSPYIAKAYININVKFNWSEGEE